MDTILNIDPYAIARELRLRPEQVQRTLELLDDGNTIPFITRYRKDDTGGLDEEQIRRIAQAASRWRTINDRRTTILKSIQSQGRLTAELAAAIQRADSLKRLEDLYLPYKPRKQTLATQARQRGLDPLAQSIYTAVDFSGSLEELAAPYVSPEKGLATVADVFQGVRHLLAERFSELADLRDKLRRLLWQQAELVSCRLEVPAKPVATESLPIETRQPSVPPAESQTSVATCPGNTSPPEAEGAAELGPAQALQPVTVEPDSTTPNQQPSAAGGDGPAPSDIGDGWHSIQADSTVGQAETACPSTPGIAAAAPSQVAASAESGTLPPERLDTAGEAVQGPSETAPASVGSSSAVVAEPASPLPVRRPTAAELRRQQRAQRKEAKRRKLQAAFKDYFDFREAINRIPPHRVLAINRGERARILKVKLEIDPTSVYSLAERIAIPATHPYRDFLGTALRDALQRLILPSLEREIRRELTERAEQHAVEVFACNLRKLLLQPPVRGRRVVAIDPGLRSGSKIVALDEFGNVLGHDVIHVIGRQERRREGRQKLAQLVRTHRASVIAIGNGSGCRETEQFVAATLSDELQGYDVSYVIVNEAGASVYSTSPLGREELPEYDPVLRSAISIGRRLLDPLSELVKIHPANIGVGLYQHDVKAKHLQASLDQVVESCVNFVGVDVNTASPALLRYVSGMNQLTARRVYEYRLQHGPFRSREELKKVAGLGEATFVQAAGFLRVHDGDNPLDATWIHPESYQVAIRVLEHLGASVEWLKGTGSGGDVSSVASAAPEREGTTACSPAAASATVSGSLDVAANQVLDAQAAGPPTADGAGCASPPAGEQIQPQVDHTAKDTADRGGGTTADTAVPTCAVEPTADGVNQAGADGVITPDMERRNGTDRASGSAAQPPGTLTLPTDRRAELAARIAQVDISALAQQLGVGELLLRDILAAFTSPGRDPREDLPPPVFRRGIMKLDDLKPGMELAGTVLNVVDFGAFVDIGLADSGLIHISRLADRYVRDPHEVVGVGDVLRVWVVDVDRARRRVSLTAIPPGTERQRRPARKPKRTDQTSAEPPVAKPAEATAVGAASATVPGGNDSQVTEQRKASAPCDQADANAAAPAVTAMEQQRQPPRPSPASAKKPPAAAEKSRTRSARPAVPLTPLTKAMEEGREPMRSFADLLQFYQKKHGHRGTKGPLGGASS